MSKDIKRLVDALLAAWNAYDLEAMTTLYAPQYEGIDVARANPVRGPIGVQQNLMRYRRAFPDIQFTGETIVEGNRAVLIWMAQGTHLGTLMNIPPTGRKIAVRGTSILTIEHGQIVRGLYIWDVAGLLRTIGLLPEL